MPARSTLRHYSLVAAAVAVLGLLAYLQFSDYLPDNMQMPSSDTARQQNPQCALAKVPKDHAFVAASVLEGGALTNLVIGPSLQVSRLVRVSITDGNKPISVFLSGSNVTWEFVGDVERVRRVVAISPARNHVVAVAGIPADRLEFPRLLDCTLILDAMSPDNEAVRVKALTVMFGRRPDHAIYQWKIDKLTLPDASFVPIPRERSANELGSLRELDPADVVSPLKITQPEILPGEVGLKQLEAAGAIRRPRAEEVNEFSVGVSLPYRSKLSPDFRIATKFDYAITRAITWPPSLFRMEPWRFLVLAGVPAPRGNPGHSCVAQMDGFRVNSIDKCLGHGYGEGIERLRKLPAAESVAHCRLLEPPASASLEAVSVYEPDKAGGLKFEEVRQTLADSSLGKRPAAFPIEVLVEKPGDVVLVLSTYNPAIWRVSSGPDTRIVGVVLISYYGSTVEGLAPDTPAAIVDQDGRVGRPETCRQLQNWLGTAYGGGPDALVLDRQVQALTGRPLDSLRGAYKLKDVVVR